MALVGMVSFSVLTSSYPSIMHYVRHFPDEFPEYKYEFSLIEAGNKYNDLRIEEDYKYYKKAIELIKEKQEKIGEGKDIKLDFLRAYSVYSMARAPPDAEHAEKYLLEAKELAKKYYEIWKHDVFLDLQASILENLGNIYFYEAENIRSGRVKVLVLKHPIIEPDGIETDKINVDVDTLYDFLNKYSVKRIIDSKDFVEISHRYRIAKDYYEAYLKFYEESGLKEIIKNYPDVIEIFKKSNDRVLSHLKTIDEILLKYPPKESSTKEENREIAEKKNNNK
jgi:tetratricopeptide (TPR) repeat protein